MKSSAPGSDTSLKDAGQLAKDRHFNPSDVEVLSKETVFDGFFKIIRYKFKHRLFAGGWSGVVEREVFERGHAAALIPYDPDTDQVVLIEQIRLPAIGTGETPWLLELVAGMLDKDSEDSAELVKREAQEEAGLTVDYCTYICNFLSSPGGSSESLDLYIGQVDATLAGGIHGLAEENEDIRVHVVDREDAYRMVQTGRINNASTIIGIQWLQLNYISVQQEWLSRTK